MMTSAKVVEMSVNVTSNSRSRTTLTRTITIYRLMGSIVAAFNLIPSDCQHWLQTNFNLEEILSW